MANELDQLTVNEAGTGWVDSVPDAASTGYQAQNTNIQSRTVGQDLSSVRVSGTDVIVDISGPIDVDGVPFSVTSEVTLTPSAEGTYYIKVVDGTTSIQKSLELTTDEPTFNAAKNALIDDDGSRVLEWIAIYDSSAEVTVYKRVGSSTDGQDIISNDLNVQNDLTVSNNLMVENEIILSYGINVTLGFNVSSVSGSLIFDILSDYLPNTNDSRVCTGGFLLSGTTYILASVLRVDSTTLRFSCITTGGTPDRIDITSTSSSTVSMSISL